jgi:hypothetical protein
MSSGNSFTFGNIQQTASGQGAVNQIGNNTATVTNHSGDVLPTPEKVFEAIEEAIPETEAPAIQEEVVEPLRAMACMPAVEQEKPENKSRALELCNRLIPYAPQIGKSLAVFGEAALSALASSNPVIAGVLAICKLGAQAT